ncbi:enoyl-CoA hydratase/isomerase family protein [Acinetobacter rudis]|uniref:enoyl-CoA hydratase/isomerase family protein n=1 Tax=Acinetobacter rudis TaxID=632955 RepID=UPI00280DF8A3|nr:enoyl-CoA hydratase/isomerase family protein [Acinetobacter rudis]MDQ8952872.1 enoyl-CoA hydratase/isomerase family protein [Acinetobacter rudis]
MSENNLLVSRQGAVGIISLDRPANLNALSVGMTEGIIAQLQIWENDSQVKAVIINSTSPKAFSAGGDVRYLYDTFKAGTTAYQDYFATEYHMLNMIRSYPKTVVALIDGYAFGGGMGLVQACHIRVSSEKSRFAMPETGIGFFPDVGGTYFLSRLQDAGVYLALTGEQFSASDALYLGLIDAIVESERLESLEAALYTSTELDQQSIKQLIADFDTQATTSSLEALMPVIKKHFSHSDLVQIEQSLLVEQQPNWSEWAEKTTKTLIQRSPLAKQISLRLQHVGRQLTLEQCLQLERNLQDIWFDHGDFIEGVRALLVDKDKQPQWQHDNARLQEILAQIFSKTLAA